MAESVYASAAAILVSAGLYAAFRFLPETVASGHSVSPYPVGKEATLLEIDQQLTEQSFQGQVRVQGETWRARLDTANPRVGDTLRVIDGEGITLICVPPDASATQGIAVMNQQPLLLFAKLGRALAGFLFALLSIISFLALAVLPIAGGLALFGLFAPFAMVLAMIAVGFPSRGPGLTVRSLRAVIAITSGFATFLGMMFGLEAIAPALSALVLVAFDPSLGWIFLAFGMGADD